MRQSYKLCAIEGTCAQVGSKSEIVSQQCLSPKAAPPEAQDKATSAMTHQILCPWYVGTCAYLVYDIASVEFRSPPVPLYYTLHDQELGRERDGILPNKKSKRK
jgi:hypothetical protein